MSIEVIVALAAFVGLVLSWVMLPGGRRPVFHRVERPSLTAVEAAAA